MMMTRPDQTETKNPTDPGNNPDFPTDELPVDDDDGGGGNNLVLPSYAVTANKGSVVEGEEIVYTITTTNVPNGKILNYQLSATNSSEDDITASDVEGGLLVQFYHKEVYSTSKN